MKRKTYIKPEITTLTLDAAVMNAVLPMSQNSDGKDAAAKPNSAWDDYNLQ